MNKHTITLDIDTDTLKHLEDAVLVSYWHAAQINPAPFGDRDACRLAEDIGREIIRRFVAASTPLLWNHQGAHINSPGAILNQTVRAEALGRGRAQQPEKESA